MPGFALFSGLAGLAAIAVFVSAIRLSYAVEARSDARKAGRRFGYTNIWAVALNIGVAPDSHTQALRRAVLVRLAIVAVLFAAMVAATVVFRPPAA